MGVSPARVAFVSPSGLGNLGDAAIIESMIAGVRRRLPGVEIVGFTLNPADTVVRHGVEAHTCGAFALPHYGVRLGARAPSTEPVTTSTSPLLRAVAAVPGARRARRLVSMALAERRHRAQVAARIAGFDF